MYLMSFKDGKHEYTTITQEQQHKITHLIRDKRIPETIKLNGKDIPSDSIIGFTETRDDTQATTPLTENGYHKFRESVTAQPWYKRHKASVALPASTD